MPCWAPPPPPSRPGAARWPFLPAGLAGRLPGPTLEGAGEGGRLRVAEQAGDVGHREGLVAQVQHRQLVAGLVHHVAERDTLGLQLALKRALAGCERVGDAIDPRLSLAQ